MTPSGRRGGRPGGGPDDGGAGGLTGGGPSQLGIDGSMRARDVSQPTADDVARAEQLVQVSYRPRSQPRPPLGGGAPRRQDGGRGGRSPESS